MFQAQGGPTFLVVLPLLLREWPTLVSWRQVRSKPWVTVTVLNPKLLRVGFAKESAFLSPRRARGNGHSGRRWLDAVSSFSSSRADKLASLSTRRGIFGALTTSRRGILGGHDVLESVQPISLPHLSELRVIRVGETLSSASLAAVCWQLQEHECKLLLWLWSSSLVVWYNDGDDVDEVDDNGVSSTTMQMNSGTIFALLLCLGYVAEIVRQNNEHWERTVVESS